MPIRTFQDLQRALRECRDVGLVVVQGEANLVAQVRGRAVFVDWGRINRHAITLTCPAIVRRAADLSPQQWAEIMRKALQLSAQYRWIKAFFERPPEAAVVIIQAQLMLPTEEGNDPMNRLAFLCDNTNLCKVVSEMGNFLTQI
ncbi:MAG: hypothetical protein DRH12_06560 [Deltaproteobacteria bacterium]|nr:MAG: hypothetical protein DRH12_06560 [Deltaproteobacteria bacterium]